MEKRRCTRDLIEEKAQLQSGVVEEHPEEVEAEAGHKSNHLSGSLGCGAILAESSQRIKGVLENPKIPPLWSYINLNHYY